MYALRSKSAIRGNSGGLTGLFPNLLMLSFCGEGGQDFVYCGFATGWRGFPPLQIHKRMRAGGVGGATTTTPHEKPISDKK